MQSAPKKLLQPLSADELRQVAGGACANANGANLQAVFNFVNLVAPGVEAAAAAASGGNPAVLAGAQVFNFFAPTLEKLAVKAANGGGAATT